MEDDTRSRVSDASKHQQLALQSRYDVYLGSEDMDGGEDDSRPEFTCPFCSEGFDIVGLCCHIDDEHPIEARNGVCPLCAARAGMDMVGHIMTEHANLLIVRQRRRFCKGSLGHYSTLLLLKKDLRDGTLQSLGGSFAPSNVAPDPLLSSFIFNLPDIDPSKDARPESLDEGSMVDKTSDEKLVQSVVPSPIYKDQVESTRRSEFVRQIVISTVFDEDAL
ncbi:protein DEHYDRATION-INDUCED 19 homolog 2 isoform X1 [Musa acuminata AAA Group]|uniref:(wild Malaysian banana) hypothetical protein n=2 Tax=Musa acuminata TaxID=4641 RepID=A0A804HMM7_MUSAM|nr:PREDICTED: protein DEHYDRATION-INDUCED 19 homolog 2-like [Musa acuminata subsp. malaccensis]CAG1842413.1 unnamed protein product [Musa acuminata subsp. malaccensis]